MKKKFDLQLFEDGVESGSGGQGGSAGTGNGSQTNAGYTYDQLEEIATSRAEKAGRAALADFFRKQGMSEEDITVAITDYKTKQKENQPNVSAIEKERDDAKKELEQMKNAGILRDKGIKAEDLDYVMFKVSQKVTDKVDFKKAAEEFLKENPRFAGQTYRVTTSTAASGTGAAENTNDSINNAIRMAARR